MKVNDENFNEVEEVQWCRMLAAIFDRLLMKHNGDTLSIQKTVEQDDRNAGLTLYAFGNWRIQVTLVLFWFTQTHISFDFAPNLLDF